jgi:heterodisulfide reductase subunit A
MTNEPASSKKGKKILFLCKCGGNISSTVDFDEVTRWAKDQGDFKAVAVSNLLCSPKGKEFFLKNTAGLDMDSIIVAACSPKQHEKTFRDLASGAGINMSRVIMANIREQCAWVTRDGEAATKKAKSLINAAVKRSEHGDDLHPVTMKVNTDTVIIGGGIAGIKTAMDLSRAGRKVYIIEREISLGGQVMKVEDLAPNMECSPCMMAPLLSQVKEDPNITVIANAEVKSVVGFFGNFTVSVLKRARYVKDNCLNCEECFEVCPVTADSDFHLGLGTRKAVYSLFPGSVPQGAVIDKDICKHFIDGSCDECVQVCPFQSINFDDTDENLSIEAGAVVVATGLKAVIPGSELFPGAGLEGVYTFAEFERLFSSNGPADREIVAEGAPDPARVAVIHCAGSFSEEGTLRCSRICCTNAVKAGEMLRKHYPDVNIINLHGDLVFGSSYEQRFYNEQKEAGTAFVRCSDLNSLTVVKAADGTLSVKGDETSVDGLDLVILSSGIVPAHGFSELASLLNIDLDPEGYPVPDNIILHPTGTVLDGIYAAGCAMMPGNISSAGVQASAVAGDILSRLIPGREIELEMMTSVIDSDRCAGCKLCISVCPYKAISYLPELRVSGINEAICRGCGTCVAACPGGAISAKHFTCSEIRAEIGGLINV